VIFNVLKILKCNLTINNYQNPIHYAKKFCTVISWKSWNYQRLSKIHPDYLRYGFYHSAGIGKETF